MPINGISSSSTAASAMQEATENAAVTKQEAAKGDQQAIRKLSREQDQNQGPAKTPGLGTVIDHLV